MRYFLLALIGAGTVLAWMGTTAAATTTTVVDVPTPRGVTQRFLYLRPDAPIATIVAMPGGPGILNIANDGSMSGPVAQCSPIARNLQALTSRGFAVALVDQTSDGWVRRFDDVQEVFRYVRARDAIPVWVQGGSASTASVGELAVSLPAGDLHGVIFASPLTLDPAIAGAITKPTLIVYHPQDEPQFFGEWVSTLTSTTNKERIALVGGSDAGCGVHLFNGLDAEFVATLADFINRHNAPSTPANYGGIWWKSPAGSESGWGINFAHQGNIIFATWYTYDAGGKAWWLTMTATKNSQGAFTGTIDSYRGPAFSAVPFSPSMVVTTPVGNGTLTFTDGNNGSFTYTVNGITQTKAITKYVFASPVPTCTYAAQPNVPAATNYQDIWWAVPAGSESGWGVNFTHQGDVIYATWFTYDVDGTPLWLSAAAGRTSPGVYTGTLSRYTGPPFSAVPFLPANVVATPVGTLTLTFANGGSGSYAYTVTLPGSSAVTQSKPIARFVFAASGGTICN